MLVGKAKHVRSYCPYLKWLTFLYSHKPHYNATQNKYLPKHSLDR